MFAYFCVSCVYAFACLFCYCLHVIRSASFLAFSPFCDMPKHQVCQNIPHMWHVFLKFCLMLCAICCFVLSFTYFSVSSLVFCSIFCFCFLSPCFLLLLSNFVQSPVCCFFCRVQAVSAVFNNYSLQLFWGLLVILFQRGQDLPAKVPDTKNKKKWNRCRIFAFSWKKPNDWHRQCRVTQLERFVWPWTRRIFCRNVVNHA